MKYALIDKANDANGGSKLHHLVTMPFVLGVTFGVGCYIAKVIVNSPLMKNIVNTTA